MKIIGFFMFRTNGKAQQYIFIAVNFYNIYRILKITLELT